MRQNTNLSVVENDVKNRFSVSENEGSDLETRSPNGPLSLDCPMVRHVDDTPLRLREAGFETVPPPN